MTRRLHWWSRPVVPNAPRGADAVAVGAYRYATRPGPAGIDELGGRFVDVHGGSDAAFGWILWRLHRLEDAET